MSEDSELREPIAGWTAFRSDTERLARKIGHALRGVVGKDEWPTLDTDTKRVIVETARHLGYFQSAPKK